jgi:hypothetical protein
MDVDGPLAAFVGLHDDVFLARKLDALFDALLHLFTIFYLVSFRGFI